MRRQTAPTSSPGHRHRQTARHGLAPEERLPRTRAPGDAHTHIHQMGWQVTKDQNGRYRTTPAQPPPAAPPESPHIDKSIETKTLAHSH